MRHIVSSPNGLVDKITNTPFFGEMIKDLAVGDRFDTIDPNGKQIVMEVKERQVLEDGRLIIHQIQV
jgi:hypothetical protein